MLNTRRAGGFTGFLLGLLFGIIVVLGGLVGAGFYAYKNVKVGTVTDKIGSDIVSEDLAALSIEKFIKEISSTLKDKDTLTIAKLEVMFPKIGGLFPDDSIAFGSLGKLDVSKLKDLKLSEISANFADAVVVTATLGSIETDMGATLPDMPFIRGGEEGKEVWSYVTATEEKDGATLVKSDYLGKELWAKTEAGEYVAATVCDTETGVHAVKEEFAGQTLYFKTNGLIDINVIDAIDALSGTLDMNALTLRDLEYKFGVNLKQNADGTESYHPVIEKMLDKKINELGSSMDETVNDLYLADVISIGENDHYMRAIAYKRDAEGDLLGVYTDGEGIESEVKVNDAGVPIDPAYGSEALPLAKVKISGLNGQIDNVRLKDLLGEQYDENDKIMKALGDTRLGAIGARVKTLTLAEVMDVSNRTLAALSYERVLVEDVLYYKAKDADGNDAENVPASEYKILDGAFVQTDGTPLADGRVPVPTAVSAVSGQVDYLLLSDCIEVNGDTPSALQALAGSPISKLGENLNKLSLADLLGKENVMGYIRASENGAILPTFESGFTYYYSADGKTFQPATAEQIAAAENLYVYDYTNVWYYVFKNADGSDKTVTLEDLGAAMDSVSSAITTAKIGELYDREVLHLSKAPSERLRNMSIDEALGLVPGI